PASRERSRCASSVVCVTCAPGGTGEIYQKPRENPMNLANEPILIRTLIGAILGLLVNFGVKLSGVQVESILALTDAVIPLALAVLGALSARGKVDGPKTATEKQAEIARLKALLNEQVEAERVPSRRPPLQSAIFFLAS